MSSIKGDIQSQTLKPVSPEPIQKVDVTPKLKHFDRLAYKGGSGLGPKLNIGMGIDPDNLKPVPRHKLKPLNVSVQLLENLDTRNYTRETTAAHDDPFTDRHLHVKRRSYVPPNDINRNLLNADLFGNLNQGYSPSH